MVDEPRDSIDWNSLFPATHRIATELLHAHANVGGHIPARNPAASTWDDASGDRVVDHSGANDAMPAAHPRTTGSASDDEALRSDNPSSPSECFDADSMHHPRSGACVCAGMNSKTIMLHSLFIASRDRLKRVAPALIATKVAAERGTSVVAERGTHSFASGSRHKELYFGL